MIPCTLYYATNRHHEGDDARPTRYGPNFSEDGHENLRFGYVTVQAEAGKIRKFLKAKVDGLGRGDGNGLAGYFKGLAQDAGQRRREVNTELPNTWRMR